MQYGRYAEIIKDFSNNNVESSDTESLLLNNQSWLSKNLFEYR